MSDSASETILNPAVLKKLDELTQRQEELLQQMADPDVIANQSLYRTVTREQGALSKRVVLIQQLRRVMSELEDSQTLLDGDDEEMAELAAAEIEDLQQKQEEICLSIQDLLLQDDGTDSRNAIVEIRAGTGGDEAGLFAMDLLKMYSRFAERRKWKVEEMDISANEAGGVSQVVFCVQGEEVYRFLKHESGGHRVQRVPTTESSGRIHTSLATVAVLPEAEDVEVEIRDEDLRIDLFCASGPGGQSVNKTTSAVRLTHLPTGLVVSCQDERSQHKNKAKAMRVLRAKLFDLEQQQRQNERDASRKSMVGSGDRSGKVRTYNFPQDRVTDHRIGQNFFGIPKILMGEIDEICTAMMENERIEKLQNFDSLVNAS
ncbi:MAG: peptide chain release factor 1 [Planctomycetota bacterium]|jgi:peptide chain release factor 1|nr:peptide chain release factor 1 [Planctomycetota bacterium]MDP7248656.1 peptide chain release factor 1 [Planctomycetota bacterium]